MTMNINKDQSIWMEKYRPIDTNDLVLPESIKQKFNQYAKNEDIPNLGLWSNNPGCILPGTTIEVQAKPKWLDKKEIIKKYGLLNKQYKLLKSYVSINKSNNKKHFIDDNTVSSIIITLIKSKYTRSLQHDKHYTSKYLHLMYWAHKLPLNEAYKKVKHLRTPTRCKYFNSLESEVFNNFKDKNSILKARMKLIYTDVLIPESCRQVEFWAWRGYSKDEALEKIAKIQDNSEHINYKTSDTNTKINYYLNKGYSEIEAKEKVSERQRTFSLEKCIKKYGLEKGQEVFNQRQIKWQETLNSKPQEEIDRINMSKGSLHIKNLNKPGLLYYIRFYNKDIEFWKVGITTRTINQRFRKKDLSGLKIEVIYSIPFERIKDAYLAEQTILKNKSRVIIEYKNFKSTECFLKDLINEI